MNQMPTDWLEQLKREYPRRSGPMRWPRVFLAVRRALFETSWIAIMEGVKRYAEYCRASGKEGSDYVVTPEHFFRDEIYLEALEFKAPEDPKVTAAKQQEEARLARITEAAASLQMFRLPLESVAAFETRVRLAQNNPRLRIAK